MTDCALCAYHTYREAIIYEDDTFIIAAHPFPLAEHELIVYPKQHVALLEELSSPLLERFFLLAAQAAVLLYETFKPAGTLILLENGPAAGQFIPHVSLSIIPREEGDGLFAWQPGTVPMERLKLIQQQLSDIVRHILSTSEESHTSQHPSITPSPTLPHPPHHTSHDQPSPALQHRGPADTMRTRSITVPSARSTAGAQAHEAEEEQEDDAYDYALENYRRKIP